MSQDTGLVPLYTTQFSTALEMLLQQKGSKLRGKTMEGSHVGKQASPVNQVGPVTLKSPEGRFAPKSNTQGELKRRWVFPQEGDINQLIDTFDELQTIVDPKSSFVTGAGYAVGRAWDDCILTATTATAYLGQDASALTAETFDTTAFRVAATFGASAATGLTVAKLIETKRIFRHYHNDLEADPLCIIIGSQQEADLLNQVQVVSTEYNDRPVLVNGKVQQFLGFDIVVMERVPQITASVTRGVIAFVKSGMYLGMWKDMTNNVSKRNDLSSEPWQLYTQVMYGATRLQPGKILQIACADTTGADITP